jgi:hypothetical protein
MRRFQLLCGAVLLSSCLVGDDAATDADDELRGGTGNLYSRIVIGRLYQTERWMLPQADGYRPEQYPTIPQRRIAYVCDALARLEPTYVSGLVRLSWDTVITDEMRTIYRGVKSCLRDKLKRPVRFDVVLNALHYSEPRATDPKNGVSSNQEGSERLRARLRSGNNLLEPDLWFFDFYTVPFNNNTQHWFAGAMRDGIDVIHRDKLLVGGNVWGRSVPAGTDFAAIPLTGGFAGSQDQIAALQKDVPTFVHIRNDPHICDSEGLDWFEWTDTRRDDAITNHASRQAALNVGYMFPVFFPLSATGECAPPGEAQVAYDAAADGMLARIKATMDRHQYRPRVK